MKLDKSYIYQSMKLIFLNITNQNDGAGVVETWWSEMRLSA